MDKKIRKNYISGLISSAILAVLGFVRIGFVKSIYGNDVDGFYVSIYALTTLVSFVESTLSSSFSSRLTNIYHSKDFEKFNKYLSMSRIMFSKMFKYTTLLFVFLAIVLPIFDSSYVITHNNVKGSTIESSVFIFFGIFPSIMLLYRAHLDVIIFANREAFLTNWKNLTSYIITLLSIIITSYFSKSLTVAVVVGTALTTIFEYGYKLWLSKRYSIHNDRVDTKIDYHIFDDMKKTSLLALITRLNMSLDAPVIQHINNTEQVSYFNSVKMAVNAVPTAVITPLITQFSNKLYNDYALGEQYFNKSFKKYSLISHLIHLLIYIPIIYLFSELIHLVKFFHVPANLELFPYVFLCSIVNYFWWQAYRFNTIGYIKLDYKFLIKPNLYALIFNFFGSIGFTIWLGAYGVWLGSTMQWIILFMIFSKRYYKNYLSEWLWAIFDLIIIGLSYFIYTYAKTIILGSMPHSFIWYIISSLPIVIILYIFVFIAYFIFISDFRKLIKIMFGNIFNNFSNK